LFHTINRFLPNNYAKETLEVLAGSLELRGLSSANLYVGTDTT